MHRLNRMSLAVRCALTVMAACAANPALAEDEAPRSLETPSIEVVGTTPVPGLGTPVDEVPSNLQVVTDEKLTETQSINLPDFMLQSLPSVSVNEVQNNPYQPNLSYRGFLSSPLLGAPQGLSVFQDGVRINEPFGDVVNYDLIPQNAISTMTLVPGSNPVFGLNTLGGAIEIRTKTGAYYPGLEAQVSGGSWGRIQADAAWGGYKDKTDYFFAVNYFEEDGWRDFSPSEVQQFFGKIGWESGSTDFDLAITYGDTDLTGNGVLPKSMLEQRRDQIYTYPDNTQNNMTMVALNASHWLNDEWLLSGLAYYRGNETKTLNGDVNDDFAGPGDPEGVLNRTQTDQSSYGFGFQASHTMERNTLAIGATIDRSDSDFVQTEQEGDSFNADRSVGDLEDVELENSLEGETQTTSLYFTDTFNFTDALAATISGRYNYTTVKADDRITPVPPNLDADYTYRKFNPAIGLTYAVNPAMTAYGGWSQGSRAPTPIELGCADPANPCSLPNSMAADPFLEQVTSQTIEAGLRGAFAGKIAWNAGLFQAANKDDILFVSAGTAASQGYFTNFGETQRRGIELGLSSTGNGPFSWSIDYSYVDATFESSACLVSESNSSAGVGCPNADEILVSPGDTMPGIPKNQLKLAGNYFVTGAWSIGATLLSFSDQYVHGNENNLHDEDGKVDGYTIVNLTTRYRVTNRWEIFARINNLFDEEYSTAGILAENSFDAGGNFITDPNNWEDETFYAPGAPLAGWIGVKFILGGTPRN